MMALLEFTNGEIICDRDKKFDFRLLTDEIEGA